MIIKNWADMNQWERAHDTIEMLQGVSRDPSRHLERLQGVVGDAQNQPPLGVADGSVNENSWYVLRDLAEAARKYTAVLADARRLFNVNRHENGSQAEAQSKD